MCAGSGAQVLVSWRNLSQEARGTPPPTPAVASENAAVSCAFLGSVLRPPHSHDAQQIDLY